MSQSNKPRLEDDGSMESKDRPGSNQGRPRPEPDKEHRSTKRLPRKPSDKQWQEHEHRSDVTDLEAQRTKKPAR